MSRCVHVSLLFTVSSVAGVDEPMLVVVAAAVSPLNVRVIVTLV